LLDVMRNTTSLTLRCLRFARSRSRTSSSDPCAPTIN
jgi:hypothetical protein